MLRVWPPQHPLLFRHHFGSSERSHCLAPLFSSVLNATIQTPTRLLPVQPTAGANVCSADARKRSGRASRSPLVTRALLSISKFFSGFETLLRFSLFRIMVCRNSWRGLCGYLQSGFQQLRAHIDLGASLVHRGRSIGAGLPDPVHHFSSFAAFTHRASLCPASSGRTASRQ